MASSRRHGGPSCRSAFGSGILADGGLRCTDSCCGRVQLEWSLGGSSPSGYGQTDFDRADSAGLSKGLRLAAMFFFDISLKQLMSDLCDLKIDPGNFTCVLVKSRSQVCI